MCNSPVLPLTGAHQTVNGQQSHKSQAKYLHADNMSGNSSSFIWRNQNQYFLLNSKGASIVLRLYRF